MKRVALVGAIALLFLLVPTRADAQDTSEVSFVNVFGTRDIYMRQDGAASYSLAAAGMTEGQILSLGTLVAGKYNFLVCGAVGAPNPTVTSCIANSATTTLAQNVNIGADKLTEIAFGRTAGGQPDLSKFNIDTKCATGRVSVGNVSQSGVATATLDAAVMSDNLGSGRMTKVNASAGSHGLAVADGASLNFAGGVDVASQQNTVVYVGGTPNFYVTYSHTVGIVCDGPPPTDPTTPIGPTADANTAANTAARTTAVNPRFAG